MGLISDVSHSYKISVVFGAVIWLQMAQGFARPEAAPSVILKEQQVLDESRYTNLVTNSQWEHLEFDNSIYTSPYKISLFNPQNGEDSQRVWSQSKLVLATVFTLAGSSFLLPDGLTNFDDERQQERESLHKKWGDHVKDGPVWDRDNTFYNYIGHPYSGGMYYQVARKSGYRQWDSAFYAFMMSTFVWEYGIESLAENPSLQDLIVTPTLGWVMGEWMFNKEQRIRQRGGTVWGSRRWGSAALFLLDPLDFIGGWINNRLGHQFVSAGTGYLSYNDVPMGNADNTDGVARDKQVSIGFQYTLNPNNKKSNKTVNRKRYQTISNDPVDTGIVGISFGIAQTRLQDQVIRLITPTWSYAYYDNFVANTYPELTLGLYFSPRFSGRLRYGRAQVQSAPSGDSFRYENYGLDLQYYFNAEANTRPFISFGIGEEIFDTDRDQTNFLLNFGLGLHHKINPKWAVYGTWIAHHSSNADITQQSFSVNLLYRFGRGEDGSL